MSEISIKTVCCTCLSTDRKLYQLCRIQDGINILYMLLTHDPEAYKQGFYKDTAHLLVCWECSATIIRIKRFQTQACVVQKHLTSIADGRNDSSHYMRVIEELDGFDVHMMVKSIFINFCIFFNDFAKELDVEVKLTTFSRLTCHSLFKFEHHFNDINSENFIDCGPSTEIKTESDSDDIPLSILYDTDEHSNNFAYGNDVNPMGKKYSKNRAKQNDLIYGNATAKPATVGLKSGCNTAELVEIDLKHSCDITEIAKNDLKNGHNIVEVSINDSKLSCNTAELDKNDLKRSCITANLATADLKHGCTAKLVKNDLSCGNDDTINDKLVQNMIKDSVISNSTEFVLSEKVIKSKDESERTGSRITKEQIHSKRTKIKYKKYFSKSTMNEKEMLNSVGKRQNDIKASVYKCDSCLLEFKNENCMNNHVIELHEMKDNCTQCDICHTYREDINAHKQTHYECYNCALCTHIAYTHIDVVRHLKRNHKEIFIGKKKRPRLKKEHHFEVSLYPCTECESTFQNKDMRWKHVQKTHREGYKCKTCDKKFAFKNNLERHERIHQAPLPREECPTCHKMIRIDLLKTHSLIHAHRQSFTCVECDKSFVCRTTYESHLKYAQAHATGDLYRHKCTSCNKGYRSRGELRDHINYHHKGQAQHKCPVCGKGLATKRCIRRHVRRAHEGIKECAKDKICQQCGKAFRDKKGLIEHERVHSGARPLSCAECGRAFRQRAALYAHTRRLHRDTTLSNSGGNG